MREAVLAPHAPAAIGAEQAVEVPERGRVLALERLAEGVATAEQEIPPPRPLDLIELEIHNGEIFATGRKVRGNES